MTTRKSQLDCEIKESLASRGREKIPTYIVQPRNLWRTWDFSTLPDAVAFGLSLDEPFDVSTNSGAFVWGWEQRPASEAEIWGEKHRQRNHATMKGEAKARALAVSPSLIAEKYRPFARLRSWKWWIHLPGSVVPLGDGPTEAKAWQAAALRLEGVKSSPDGGQQHHSTKTGHATKKRKARLVQVRAETPAGYRWLLAHARGATSTLEGFAVTDEEEWSQSLAAADAFELK